MGLGVFVSLPCQIGLAQGWRKLKDAWEVLIMNQYKLGLKSTVSTASWGCYFSVGKKRLANQNLSLSLEQEKWRVESLCVRPSLRSWPQLEAPASTAALQMSNLSDVMSPNSHLLEAHSPALKTQSPISELYTKFPYSRRRQRWAPGIPTLSTHPVLQEASSGGGWLDSMIELL